MSTGSGSVAVTGSRAKSDAFEEGGLHVAGHDAENAPLGVDHHVDDEIAAGHAGDGRVLFVDRVAVAGSRCGRWGVRETRGPCQTLTVSSAARPGQISFRPPEKPAMKCGSISPVVIFRSAWT